jgi:hypothetical protein
MLLKWRRIDDVNKDVHWRTATLRSPPIDFSQRKYTAMTGFIFQAHSGWRYIVLLMLVITIAKMLIGMVSSGRWSSLDEWLNRLTPIVIDIQVLLGLILWIIEQRWNGADPLASWEHPITMIIASVLTHATQRRIKAAPTDAAKYQAGTIGYLIAGIVVALGVARITRVI